MVYNNPMEIIIPLTVKIIVDKHSKDAPYVAYNPEFDVASCGPTEEKARENLQTTVKIFMEETRKQGKLNETLEELGFQKDKQGWIPPRVSFESFYFPTVI